MKYKEIVTVCLLILCSCIIMVSCKKEDKEPDVSRMDGEYVMPDATLLTPEQTEILRLIVAEYNDAIAD